MNGKPQQEHKWLEQLLGEWTYETEAAMNPGEPAGKVTWAENVRSVGGLWVVCEGRGDIPGAGPGTTVMTLGYDPAKKKYVGTFIGSMMNHLWVYEGELDGSGKVLTLNTVGPNFGDPGKMVNYQDVIEIKGDGHRVLTSYARGDDGGWHKFMTATYRRTR